MFEKELRSVLAHFDYSRAIRICHMVHAEELKNHYEVSNDEDRMYWELDAKIAEAENWKNHDKPKVNGSGIWVEVW